MVHAVKHMEGVLSFFTGLLPGKEADVQIADLIPHIGKMAVNVIPFLEDDHCNQGASWASYTLAGGLYVQLLQEECQRQLLE